MRGTSPGFARSLGLSSPMGGVRSRDGRHRSCLYASEWPCNSAASLSPFVVTLALMTTANKITLVRILMIPAFVTMAIYYGQSIERGAPLEWQRFTAILIFLVASISDGLDGYVARRYNQRSSLGVILDPIADKGLLLSGIITLSISNWSKVDPEYGRFPVWFPVLVISRDAVILVGTAVLYFLVGHVKVKPNWTGKVATVLQMIAIAWVMLQLQWVPLIWVVAAAGLFTLISGIIYVLEGVRQLQAEGHANAR
ncbi:MAG: CDP-diacylglycerol--glycerol-3-phosphate 3-phosphatidyltransferase [Verrucomicrobia bacterium]|nr:MAG: CDP-diacylglycerol--glycerol-3-phosphate 3-phosphatidyltransferase [Verrucomicrobiota bacterium]